MHPAFPEEWDLDSVLCKSGSLARILVWHFPVRAPSVLVGTRTVPWLPRTAPVPGTAEWEHSSEEICRSWDWCSAENFPRHRPGMRERKHPSELVATEV